MTPKDKFDLITRNLQEVIGEKDLEDLFIDRFYFGCEADDRMIPIAFDTKLNRNGARLKAIFSSDIGHWDVIDATNCLSESVDLVKDGLMSEVDLRDFAFNNSVELHGMMNPDFFKGTVVESEAAAVLANAKSSTVAAE